MTAKRIFKVLKTGILVAVLLVIARYLTDSAADSFLLLAIEFGFYTAVADLVFTFVNGILNPRARYPIKSIILATWFAFLKIMRVYELLLESSSKTSGEVLTLITLITTLMLIVYLILSFREIFEIKKRVQIPPASLIALSFAVIISLGAILLFLPMARQPCTEPLPLLDALFTSTSALCVTGLIVVDTGSYFSMFGQIVILVLIQIGALGIMTFAIFVTFLLGGKMSYYGKITAGNALSEFRFSGVGGFIANILKATFLVELFGAILLFLQFRTEMPALTAIYHSVYHSISAFCNAGFSLYSDSMMAYRSNFLINITVMSLIVLGGLGFSVLPGLRKILFPFGNFNKPKRQANLHTRMVLTVSLSLIILGAVVFFFLEKGNLLNGLSTGDKIMTSLFSSVTTRTAGFNTVDFGQAHESSLFFMSLFMFIGASPGSTGGGIKTTTFMLLLLSILFILRDQPRVSVFGREISTDLIRKATVLFFLSLGWVLIIIFLMSVYEPFKLSQISFEAVSAFGTVGLSTGITPQLSSFSKGLIIASMFIGRVGPLTLMASIGMRAKKTLIRRPEEKVLIG